MIAVFLIPPLSVFWVSVLILLYTYVGYPALCWLRSRLQVRPWQGSSEFRPLVSVVVAAFNEEQHIADRITNIVAQQTDFPFEILIGSDGSTDRTVERARHAAAEARDPGIEIRIDDLARAGKMATLATLVQGARGEVIVFTDANCRFAPGAMRAIVAPLADSSVGCAAGVKCIDSGNIETASGERSYWSVESALKKWESSFASCAGADGALYAVRKDDLPAFPTNRLIADDFYVSLSGCACGRRCVLVPDAIVLEPSDTTERKELKRKARIFACALAAIAEFPRLLLPGSGISLTLWSHKVLRWFSFVPLCAMLICGFALSPAAAAAFYIMVIMAACVVLIGAAFPATLSTAPIKLMYYFALMNFGQILGVVEWVRRGDQPAWEKVR